MTEFNSVVEKQKILIEAQKWAKGFKSVHVFNQDNLSSLWYDTRTKDGWVTDIQYNNGLIERTIHATNEKIFFGKESRGDNLINSYMRNS
jgi:hypothetical protein